MFVTQGKDVQNYSGLTNASTPPPAPGIASKIQELQEAVATTCQLSASIVSALGISHAEQGTEPKNPRSSLIEVLTDLRVRLYNANAETERAITHINS